MDTSPTPNSGPQAEAPMLGWQLPDCPHCEGEIVFSMSLEQARSTQAELAEHIREMEAVVEEQVRAILAAG